MLADTVDHLLHHVLPAIAEYETAEASLSKAYTSGNWGQEGKTARRKAAEVAVAIDGLADRAKQELNISLETIRADVSALCMWPGSQVVRREAFERVHGVANAYKHSMLTKKTHVINSFEDVLTVGLDYGLDGYGVGKYGGVEVLVKDKQGTSWKFLGDVPTVISAWVRFLSSKGAQMPNQALTVCGVSVHP